MQGPVAAVTLISAVTGALVVFLFGLPGWLSAHWRIRGLERRLEGRPSDAEQPETRKA